MESLTATVDARDAYTAGHSRRVQQLALAIGARARPVARGAGAARVRGALPRHRQARAARTRSCSSRRGSTTAEWALIMRAPGRRRVDHRAARLPERRRARRSATTTSATTAAATPTGSPATRSRSARGSSTSPTRSTRCSRPASTARRARSSRRSARSSGWPGRPVLPALRAALRAVIGREKAEILADAERVPVAS